MAVRGAPGSLVGTGACVPQGRRERQTPCAPFSMVHGAPWPEAKGPGVRCRRLPHLSRPPRSRAAIIRGQRAGGREPVGRWLAHHRGVLLIAFAFTVMADPVSSVAYAIEAALRALGGESLATAADHGRRDRHHRRGDRQLQPARGAISARRRSGGGGGHGVRRGLCLSPARGPGRRLRAHHRDQHRRRDVGDRGVPPRGAHDPRAAGARPAVPGRGAHLVRSLGPDPVRAHDAVVRRDRRSAARLGLQKAGGHARPCHRPRLRHRPLFGGARVPRRHGSRDRCRGAVVRDRPARPARRRWPPVLRQGHALADPARGRRPHDGHHRAGRPAEDRHPPGQQHADRRRGPCRRFGRRSSRCSRRPVPCSCWPPPARPFRPAPGFSRRWRARIGWTGPG